MVMAMRAPIAGISMASSMVSSSAPPCNRGVIVVRAPPFRPFFFGRGVGTPTYTAIRLSYSSRSRCNSLGGGGLGTQMNLFDRFADVVKLRLDSVISSFDHPKKILEHTVIAMNGDLIKLSQVTAQVLAFQKQMENKYKAAQKASEDWYARAQLALDKGDEELAREALKRRKSYADNANSLKTQLDQQKRVVENLVSDTRLLESKIHEAKPTKRVLQARAQWAKTLTKVSEMLGKIKEKVMEIESQAEAINQLTSDELDGKFAMLESSSVDDYLASLMRAESTKKGNLPPERTVASALKFQDPEIEKELNELRQKTKEY